MPKHVITVTGKVPFNALGITDAHSHVWIDTVPGGHPEAPILDNEPQILHGLKDYKQTGGGAIVDCQPFNCGRNANQLHKLSAASGVKIVACTGFHLRRYYADDTAPLWDISAEAAHTFFVDEIRNGLTETRDQSNIVYPGFIKIAAEATLATSPLHLFEAAAAAAIETGYAIEMHTERGAAVEDFLAFFTKQGVSTEQLVFCHVDKRPDFALHKEMARAGIMLEYDTFYLPKYNPEQNVWVLLQQMIDTGLHNHIALATDMADAALWQNPGLTAFLTHIQARLQSMGVEPIIINKLMGGNIATRLAIKE